MYYSAHRKSQGHSWQEVQARDQSRYPGCSGHQVAKAVNLSGQRTTSQHAMLHAVYCCDCTCSEMKQILQMKIAGLRWFWKEFIDNRLHVSFLTCIPILVTPLTVLMV